MPLGESAQSGPRRPGPRRAEQRRRRCGPIPTRCFPTPEVAAVVEARHGDPFAVLGMHKTAAGVAVRAMLPDVRQVLVIESATGAVAAEGVRVHPDRPFCRRNPQSQGAVSLSVAGGERRLLPASSTTSTAFRRCSANSTSICSPKAIISPAIRSSARIRSGIKGAEGVGLCNVGAQCALGQPRRRLQRLGRQGDADAATRRHRVLGAFVPGLRPGHFTSTSCMAPTASCCR